MDKRRLKFLSSLCEAVGPSGYEDNAAAVWKEYVSRFADVVTDVHGNTMAVVNKKAKRRIMLSGHIDEIGLMVVYIDDKGFIYFNAIGGIDPEHLVGQRVRIHSRGQSVLGVIGKLPIHLQDKKQESPSKVSDLYIDVGLDKKADVEELVEIGSIAVIDVGFSLLTKDRAVSKAFDDRAGAFVVACALEEIARKCPASLGVYATASVQEEIGLRGARTSAYGIDPEAAIAVDVTFATDCPGIEKKKIGDISLGKGPVIARGPNINHKMFDLLVKTAKSKGLPYQIEGISRATGTDANAIQVNKKGVATGLVSVPLRYMHSPVEMLDLNDLDHAIGLVSGAVRGMAKIADWRPY